MFAMSIGVCKEEYCLPCFKENSDRVLEPHKECLIVIQV